MKKTGMLCAVLLVACGGSSSKGTQPTSPASDVAAASSETSDLPPMANPEPTPVAPTPAEPAAPPVEVAPPPPPTAIAMLTTVKDGKDVGMVSFELGEANKLTIKGEFTGLPPGPHAIYIHEGNTCDNKGKKVGKHLNPTGAKHGPPSSSVRHAGDFGNIDVDKSGAATFTMETDSLSMEPGRADTLTDRALVIHAKKDDKAGSGGAVLACGVITMKEASSDANTASPAAKPASPATP